MVGFPSGVGFPIRGVVSSIRGVGFPHLRDGMSYSWGEFVIRGVGFPIRGLGLSIRGLGFPICGLGFPIRGLGFPIRGVGFPIHGVGFPFRGAYSWGFFAGPLLGPIRGA